MGNRAWNKCVYSVIPIASRWSECDILSTIGVVFSRPKCTRIIGGRDATRTSLRSSDCFTRQHPSANMASQLSPYRRTISANLSYSLSPAFQAMDMPFVPLEGRISVSVVKRLRRRKLAKRCDARSIEFIIHWESDYWVDVIIVCDAATWRPMGVGRRAIFGGNHYIFVDYTDEDDKDTFRQNCPISINRGLLKIVYTMK